jgi:hypothetical protein
MTVSAAGQAVTVNYGDLEILIRDANTLKMQSKGGKEFCLLNARKDMVTRVGNDELHIVIKDRKTEIGKDEITLVKKDRKTEIGKNEITVIKEGNRTTDIDRGDDILNVKNGQQKVTVRSGASLEVEAGNRVVAVPTGDYVLKAQKVWIESTSDDLTLKCGLGKIHMSQDGNILITGQTVMIVGKNVVRINCPKDEAY